MLNAHWQARLDRVLQAYRKFLTRCTDPASVQRRIEVLVRAFTATGQLEDLTSKLLYQNWPDSWKVKTYPSLNPTLHCGLFSGASSISADSTDKLFDLFYGFARLLVEGTTPFRLNECVKALPFLMDSYLDSRGITIPVPAPQNPLHQKPVRVLAAPVAFAMNWREILDTVGLPFNTESKNRVRKLSVDFSGPIVFPQRGGQPKAAKAKLLDWWNGLEQQFQEQAQREADTAETVRETFAYGRGSTVVPAIAGHVKKRRQKQNP